MKWVGSPMNLLKYIETIVPKDSIVTPKPETQILSEENIMENEKQLILDQPDTITKAGKIERVVVTPDAKPLNDGVHPVAKTGNEVLLTEDPLDGVEIILG